MPHPFVTFLERYYQQEQTAGNTAQQIFSDAGGVNDLGFSSFEFQYNDVDVTNDATVTTPTTWAKSSDATSITANGLQSKKVATSHGGKGHVISPSEGLPDPGDRSRT